MSISNRGYEPHLTIRELSLLPEGEWAPRLPGWTLCQVYSGTGYWIHPDLKLELECGSVLLLKEPGKGRGSIRASRLDGLSTYYFNVEPARLTGLLTLAEQRHFDSTDSNRKPAARSLAPDSAPAARMKALCTERSSGCPLRLRLLQLWIDVVGIDFKPEAARSEASPDAKERLRDFLNQTPASDLLHLRFSDLGRLMRCTPRHLSRIFREEVGLSFREIHAELRLVRARELLASSDSKIVDIALESGFHSLSLFNLMFARRFGMSPGKWRQKFARQKTSPPRERKELAGVALEDTAALGRLRAVRR